MRVTGKLTVNVFREATKSLPGDVLIGIVDCYGIIHFLDAVNLDYKSYRTSPGLGNFTQAVGISPPDLPQESD